MVSVSEKITKAVAARLEEGDESPELLAKAVIEMVDEHRANKPGHMVVCEFGHGPGEAWYIGYGPYATANQARRAAERNPASFVAKATVVVPTTSPLGLEKKLSELDERPAGLKVETTTKVRPGDPHISNIDELWVLDKEKKQWKRIYQNRRGSKKW